MALPRSALLVLAGVVACGRAVPSRSSSPAATQRPTAPRAAAPDSAAPAVDAFRLQTERLIAEIEAVRELRFVGMDDGPVPPFDLQSMDGTRYDSSELVGHRPFVVAFFATWCEFCEAKLRSLRQALDQSGAMLVLPVSFDDSGDYPKVERYLEGLGIEEPAVMASAYPLMALSYDPFNTVPLLVIVGQNGGLVDYQLGYDLEHERRLEASLRLAHVIAPLAPPSKPAGD